MGVVAQRTVVTLADMAVELGERLLGSTGDECWDVLFAGLTEYLAMRDGRDAPG
jgi:hypothetical protein